MVSTSSQVIQDEFPPPAVIKQIPIGDPNVRSPLRFEVVTARVVDVAGKKHVVRSLANSRIIYLYTKFYSKSAYLLKINNDM